LIEDQTACDERFVQKVTAEIRYQNILGFTGTVFVPRDMNNNLIIKKGFLKIRILKKYSHKDFDIQDENQKKIFVYKLLYLVTRADEIKSCI